MSDEAAKLLALAERCEKATGPDRHLNLAIANAVYGDALAPENTSYAYTSSLDAAAALAPEGHGWRLWMPSSGSPESINVTVWHNHRQYAPRMTEGASPALALSAAFLRARAAILKDQSNAG